MCSALCILTMEKSEVMYSSHKDTSESKSTSNTLPEQTGYVHSSLDYCKNSTGGTEQFKVSAYSYIGIGSLLAI